MFPEHTANKFRVSAASMPSSESEVFRERRRGKRARDEDGRRATGPSSPLVARRGRRPEQPKGQTEEGCQKGEQNLRLGKEG